MSGNPHIKQAETVWYCIGRIVEGRREILCDDDDDGKYKAFPSLLSANQFAIAVGMDVGNIYFVPVADEVQNDT